MKNQLKRLLKKILFHLHLDLTRNQQYDRQTLQIMRKILRTDSCCIDIGCHRGEMMDVMLQYSPSGTHWAFEPLPKLHSYLKNKYSGKDVHLYAIALSDEKKTIQFQHVVNAPAYSGIKKRKYNCLNPKIEEIKVYTDLLDNLVPADKKVEFIKIDVEGGEYGVLKGGMKLLTRNKPVVIFEFGLGAADYYNTSPDMMYELLSSCGMKISLMCDFLKDRSSLSKQEFAEQFQKARNYYFVAHP